ncbi:hypothetical protein [Siminovitchia terrae]|nr:hypothetical protein [Siminovitchia terrae]
MIVENGFVFAAHSSWSKKNQVFNFIQQKSPTSISGEMNAYW